MPRPGEVSLAHNGVLFLDELPEFHRHVLDVLRQPLEDGEVTIARAAMSLTFPARFMLAAAMNPCQCGYFGDTLHECTCTPPLIQRYLARVSGPLLDRIDLHIQVPAVKYKELAQDEKSEESSVMRERILAARYVQGKRLESFGIYCNAQMTPRTLRRFCKLDSESEKQMENAITRLGLSARAYDRILRVSRTMADLEKGRESRRATWPKPSNTAPLTAPIGSSKGEMRINSGSWIAASCRCVRGGGSRSKKGLGSFPRVLPGPELMNPSSLGSSLW